MIVRTSHNGGIKGFLERFKNIGKPKVYVGVPSSANTMHKPLIMYKGKFVPTKQSISMASLLALHTLGAPSRGIPPRDGLRPPLRENADKYAKTLADGIRKNLTDGLSMDTVYGKIGNDAMNDVKAYFVSGKFTPLKQSTIDAKGSSAPLISTGELRNSISYEVRK